MSAGAAPGFSAICKVAAHQHLEDERVRPAHKIERLPRMRRVVGICAEVARGARDLVEEDTVHAVRRAPAGVGVHITDHTGGLARVRLPRRDVTEHDDAVGRRLQYGDTLLILRSWLGARIPGPAVGVDDGVVRNGRMSSDAREVSISGGYSNFATMQSLCLRANERAPARAIWSSYGVDVQGDQNPGGERSRSGGSSASNMHIMYPVVMKVPGQYIYRT